MKLTWFGGTTLRIYIGGRILVCDPAGAPAGIDSSELVSGADRTFELDGPLPPVAPSNWQPRRAGSLLNETTELPEVLVHRIGPGAVLVDAVGEPPLVLATGTISFTARWTRDAVVAVLGDHGRLPAIAASALQEMAPRLIALAGPEPAIEAVILEIGNRLDGTSLLSLEPGLALEV